MMGSGTALGSLFLIVCLLMNETIPINKTKEEIKKIFLPTLVALTVIFASTVLAKILEVM